MRYSSVSGKMNVMITVKNLTKAYGDALAIKDLSFEIAKGEIIGFLGPNGAGKTTTMKILTCLMPPTSGEVLIQGMSIVDQSYAIRQLIGYLPENNPLYPEMSVYDYLVFVARLRQIKPVFQSSKIQRVVNACQLRSVIHQPIDTLSKGFRQRVGLAQALIHEPELLILDEPTSGLDPAQIIEIRSLIKQLGQSTTVILCSHILSEVAATCSRVFILKQGQIVADGEPKTLTRQAQGEKIIYVDANQSLDVFKPALQEFGEVVRDVQVIDQQGAYSKFRLVSGQDIRDDLYQLMVRNKWQLRELKLEETSLEDVFVDLTRDGS